MMDSTDCVLTVIIWATIITSEDNPRISMLKHRYTTSGEKEEDEEDEIEW